MQNPTYPSMAATPYGAPARDNSRTRANAQQLINEFERAEIDPSVAPDKRRVFRDERFALITALRSGDPEQIVRARNEALRVRAMWAGY